MKKAVLLILFCMGSVLLMHVAHADEPGFGGDVFIGTRLEIGSRSQLDATSGSDRRAKRLDDNGENDIDRFAYIVGNLRYTLADGSTTFYLADMGNQPGLALGMDRTAGKWGRMNLAITYDKKDVWEDPYLTGISRSRTDETAMGVSFGLDDILASGFNVSTAIQRVNVDDDEIGDRLKKLRRDGYRSRLEVGYTFVLKKNHTLIPSIRYSRSDMRGEANSDHGIGLAVGYIWRQDRWGVEASAGLGRTRYRSRHPVYSKTREANTFDLKATVSYYEPFGWRQVSVFSTGTYRRAAENIDFFDQDLWSAGVGIGYHF